MLRSFCPQPKIATEPELLVDDGKAQAIRMLARSIIGSPQTVRAGLDALVAETGADERIITLDVYDDAARLRSFELIAENRDGGADAVVAGIETVGARDEG